MSTFTTWKILHLALNENIPGLPAYSECQGVYVVFWWHSIPLGDHWILATHLPMSATQLVNLALQTITETVSKLLFQQDYKVPLPELTNNFLQKELPDFHTLVSLNQPLSQLRTHLLQPVSDGKSVSVVVPTKDRPEQLARCLHSLQDLSQRPYEILVVDNALSSDATRQLVAQIPDIQYILEPQPGASKARNTGIDHATGDIIAFIDDDMTAHPDWIVRLQQSFQNPEVMAVTGLVLPGELETEAQFIFEKYWSFNRGYSPLNFGTQFFEQMKNRGVPVWLIGGSGNMAIRRNAFDMLGKFDERLGGGAKAAGCSEDSEFLYRLLAENLLCCYEPMAVAYHYHRKDMGSLKKQAYSYMRGHVAALLIQSANYKHWGNLRRLFLALPKYYTKLFLSGLIKGFKPRHSTLLVEILGCFSGVSFYLQNRYFPTHKA